MNTASGLIFTYALGLIFVVGGIVFLAFLGDNNVLFGLPYLVIGLLLCYGAWRAGKGMKRRAAAAEVEVEAQDDDGPVPPAGGVTA